MLFIKEEICYFTADALWYALSYVKVEYGPGKHVPN